MDSSALRSRWRAPRLLVEEELTCPADHRGGPGEDDGGVYPEVGGGVETGRDLPAVGEGLDRQCPVHVVDLRGSLGGVAVHTPLIYQAYDQES